MFLEEIHDTYILFFFTLSDAEDEKEEEDDYEVSLGAAFFRFSVISCKYGTRQLEKSIFFY